MATTDQQQFDNELRGVLFPNDKGGVEKRPDYRGTCQVDGKGYRLSGWVRSAKESGQRFLSLSLTRDETLDPAPGTGTDIPADTRDLF